MGAPGRQVTFGRAEASTKLQGRVWGAEEVARVIGGYRVRYAVENDMQEDVQRILAANDVQATREHPLGAGDRPDFFVPDGGVAIECKVAGGVTDVFLQLARYAGHAKVKGIVLVTSMASHRRIDAVEGMPVHLVFVSGVL